MRERAKLAGGDFENESSASGGTTIYVRIPLAARTPPLSKLSFLVRPGPGQTLTRRRTLRVLRNFRSGGIGTGCNTLTPHHLFERYD
jgi:hypothetical protein